MKNVTVGVRILQALTAAIVLALSVNAIRWQQIGTAPATTGFSAFVGAFGIFAALIGVVGLYISLVPDTAVIVIDGLAVACFAVAGVTLSVRMRGMNCTRASVAAHYKDHANAFALFNSGYKDDPVKGPVYGCAPSSEDNEYCDVPALVSKCHAITADAAFLWFTFLACIVATVLAWRLRKRSGISSSSAA
ncbi:hypothetical protein B0A48_10426 [Cryoendolithus antarcticus]|uniref:MARVEL domain-containing protein n=1 Tax=Cryoendolithus antarcticus TaxID=1507870 RepID=A0A1V8SX97_9PEZI|nr:hypothetical protein B0A48_10426 [Cryoendolithus antarcticus]